MTAPTLAQRVAARCTEMDRELDEGVILDEDFTHHALPALAEFVLAADDCAGISTSDDIARYDAALSALARALGVEK